MTQKTLYTTVSALALSVYVCTPSFLSAMAPGGPEAAAEAAAAEAAVASASAAAAEAAVASASAAAAEDAFPENNQLPMRFEQNAMLLEQDANGEYQVSPAEKGSHAKEKKSIGSRLKKLFSREKKQPSMRLEQDANGEYQVYPE